jgi:hypothetical protein
MYNLSVGQVAKFTLHEDLRDLNGLYKVLAILNYAELEMFDMDPVQELYIACDRGADYIEQSIHLKYRNDVYYKLENVYDIKKVFYVPHSLIVQIPELGYQPHHEIMLTINLGVYRYPDELKAVKTFVETSLQTQFGITNPGKIVSFNTVWLDNAGYKEHTDMRDMNKRTTDSTYVALKKAQAELAECRAKLAAYEEVIINMSS